MMNKVIAIFGAMALTACATCPSAPTQAAAPAAASADPVFPARAATAPAGACDTWGAVKGRSAESSWDIVRVAPGGAEEPGTLKLLIAENGDVSGEWVLGETKGGVWGWGGRVDGPTLRGHWGATREDASSGILLRRWSTVSVGGDDKSYCSFDGDFRIKGDPVRYTIRGYRVAE